MKKSFRVRKGRTFASAGLGKHGPYALVSQRVGKKTYAKASIGTLGAKIGIKYSGIEKSIEGSYNLTKKPQL